MREREGSEGDLRQVENWLSWVDRQDGDVRESLALAIHQFVEKTDTILIVFDSRGTSSLSAEMCEKVVSLIWAHYKVRIADWADAVVVERKVASVGHDMLMPNIAFEVAPPNGRAH